MIYGFFEVNPFMRINFKEFAEQIFGFMANIIPVLTLHVINASNCVEQSFLCIALRER